MLVATNNLAGGESRRTVTEERAVLDQGLVGERAIGDEDGGPRADTESDNGAEFGVEVAEDGFGFGGIPAKPCDAAEDREGGGAGREVGSSG